MNTASLRRLIIGACALVIATAATGACTRTVTTEPAVGSVSPGQSSILSLIHI